MRRRQSPGAGTWKQPPRALPATVPRVRFYADRMRKGLTPDDLGDLLDLPITATLATYQADGRVRLSAVWHEWRDGGFTIVIGANSVMAKHLRNDPRVAITVHESSPPWRGIEIRTIAQFVDTDPSEADQQLAARYLSPQEAAAFAAADHGPQTVVRLTPGEIRAWDFADDPIA